MSVQGFRQQALAVSTDPEHKFDLALHLGEVKIAYQLALEAEVRARMHVHTQTRRKLRPKTVLHTNSIQCVLTAY